MLPSRNMWRYFWADATSIAAYVPVRRESFDLSVGTGISIRRIISHTINGNPNTISDLDNRMYEWSYFLPTRIGADFHLAGGRQVVCAIEYQVSLRDIYKPAEVTGPYDYTAWVNKLHSVSLSVGYMISIPKK